MEAAELISAIKPLLPPPPPGAPGPFALSDEVALKKFASDAGLTPLEIFDVDAPLEYPDLETAIRGLNSSGVAVRAIEHAGEEAVSRAHADVLARFKAPGGCRIHARFRCLLAKR